MASALRETARFTSVNGQPVPPNAHLTITAGTTVKLGIQVDGSTPATLIWTDQDSAEETKAPVPLGASVATRAFNAPGDWQASIEVDELVQDTLNVHVARKPSPPAKSKPGRVQHRYALRLRHVIGYSYLTR